MVDGQWFMAICGETLMQPAVNHYLGGVDV